MNRLFWSSSPNRYICDVLKEMRTCHETRNYGYLLGLIEEAQTLANRMEAGLEDFGDYKDMLRAKKQLKKELEELEEKVDGKSQD